MSVRQYTEPRCRAQSETEHNRNGPAQLSAPQSFPQTRRLVPEERIYYGRCTASPRQRTTANPGTPPSHPAHVTAAVLRGLAPTGVKCVPRDNHIRQQCRPERSKVRLPVFWRLPRSCGNSRRAGRACEKVLCNNLSWCITQQVSGRRPGVLLHRTVVLAQPLPCSPIPAAAAAAAAVVYLRSDVFVELRL